MTLTREAKARMEPRKEGESVDLEAKFEPNLLNSVVYLISMGMQVCCASYRLRFNKVEIQQVLPLFFTKLFWITELESVGKLIEFVQSRM